MEFGDAPVNLFEAHRVRVPHRAAAIRGGAVAVEINNVYVRSAQGVAFFQNARAFVDERVEAAVHDFGGGNFALRDSCFRYPFANQFIHDGIGQGATLFVVFVPASFYLLAEAAELAEIVFDERLADTGFFQVTIFFADAPADIEAGEISGGERAHGHAEIGESFIDGGDAGAFFDEELGFAAIGTEHAIADEAATIAHEHADFAERFRKLHAGGDHFFAGGFAADDFEQAHDVRGTEEMCADDVCGTRSGGSDFVNVERGSITGEDGAGFADAIEFFEDFFFQGHAFEDSFDDQVDFCEIVVGERGSDAFEPLFGVLRSEAAALDGIGVIRLDGGEPAIERGLVCIF